MFKFHRMTTLIDPFKPLRFINKTAHVHTQSIIHTYTLKSCLFYFNSCAHVCCKHNQKLHPLLDLMRPSVVNCGSWSDMATRALVSCIHEQKTR